MITTLLKLGLLLLSYFGYWEFFRERCRINVFFSPAFTIAAQFTVMFLPGLLNFLPEAAWCIYLGGFVLLTDALRREKLDFFRHYANWGYALLLMALALMALAFRGKVVTWFDNFTHWAVAVKNMLATDRFPTFAQEAVTFTTYPLGSTTMIYYFCRFINGEEDIWMLAQGFVMLCMLLPMFAFGKKDSILAAAVLALTGNFLLCYNIPLTELLVDTLLPLAGTALILFIHSECLRKESALHVFYAVPFLFWVMNIKNAGLLFVLAGVGILLWHKKRQGEELKTLLIGVLVLMAGYFLWDRHCDYVFYQSEIIQHDMSLDYFGYNFSQKNIESILKIITMSAQAMLLRRELAWLLGGVLTLGILTWLMAPWKKRQYRNLVVFLLVMYVIYGISLMAMYVFSMSLEGALELQSMDRYVRIGESVAWYFLAVYAVSLMAQCKGKSAVGLLLTAGMVCCTLGYYGSFRSIAQVGNGDLEKRLRAQAPIAEYGVEPGRSYLICAEDDRVWFPAFLWAYHLDSCRTYQIKVTDAGQMELEKYYDYVAILDEGNPILEQWVEDTYPEQAGQTVIQCFK